MCSNFKALLYKVYSHHREKCCVFQTPCQTCAWISPTDIDGPGPSIFIPGSSMAIEWCDRKRSGLLALQEIMNSWSLIWQSNGPSNAISAGPVKAIWFSQYFLYGTKDIASKGFGLKMTERGILLPHPRPQTKMLDTAPSILGTFSYYHTGCVMVTALENKNDGFQDFTHQLLLTWIWM
jgi:hypothetical protein